MDCCERHWLALEAEVAVGSWKYLGRHFASIWYSLLAFSCCSWLVVYTMSVWLVAPCPCRFWRVWLKLIISQSFCCHLGNILRFLFICSASGCWVSSLNCSFHHVVSLSLSSQTKRLGPNLVWLLHFYSRQSQDRGIPRPQNAPTAAELDSGSAMMWYV